ncbi:HET-domain-containing protein, partial [Acephala macrosclerotiorum]
MADPNPELIPSASVVPTSSPYALSLEDDSRGIRIALLQPGQWEDPIYCELTKTSLESPLQFEALSYVWAQERGTKSIVLNGLTHTVTTNLFMALRRLRKHREVRSIWIDALCIDQNNIEERNHQVTLMGNIYWTCTKTIAWLG